ncbi:MAG: hypothetical protein D4R84_07950 [Rhodocyclaceae bacterium]|nr:MAG: hypothetical protein D4R84_07950 [Rhodocyclaceae bacterium]
MNKISMLRWVVAVGLCMFAPLATAASPELMAALSVTGHGYKVKVTINGADVGVEGGKNENRRLFNKDHETAAKASPSIGARNFVLVPGSNEIAIEYAKNDPKGSDELEITLQAANYPQPLLRLVNKTKTADKVVVSVNIAEKPPADFKPAILESK